MKLIKFSEFRAILEKKGLNFTLLYLDTLFKKGEISKQLHRVVQNWITSISRKYT
jgi:hypothetical protein